MVFQLPNYPIHRTMNATNGNSKLRVLVVDDSAVVRQILSQLLERDRRISVVTSPDPVFALKKIANQRPDVIITDIEMPRMDGISFVRTIMRSDPIPMIVCSGNAVAGAGKALRALEEGAVEIITKPKVGVREFLEESAQRLLDMVWEVAHSRIQTQYIPAHAHALKLTPRMGPVLVKPNGHPVQRPHVIAIGASTGGTEAIREILLQMQPQCPGIVIVQHMPEMFTRAFADHLDRDCAIAVKEAQHGDCVLEGHALVAPGNRHLALKCYGSNYVVELSDGPAVCHHRPSVDVLFQSVAATAGRNAVGILLTGMGRDGAAGLLEMKRAGSRTIAQDEASCIVFGMPAEAVALGAADEILPLSEIPKAILNGS